VIDPQVIWRTCSKIQGVAGGENVVPRFCCGMHPKGFLPALVAKILLRQDTPARTRSAGRGCFLSNFAQLSCVLII
jgi:hypothetical protein